MYTYLCVSEGERERGGGSGTRMDRDIYYWKLIETLTVLKIPKLFLGCTRFPYIKLGWIQRKAFGREEDKVIGSGLFWHAAEGRS